MPGAFAPGTGCGRLQAPSGINCENLVCSKLSSVSAISNLYGHRLFSAKMVGKHPFFIQDLSINTLIFICSTR